MSGTVHYVPFATDYQRLLPPLIRADSPPDRVVIVRQRLPDTPNQSLEQLIEAFESQLAQEDIEVDHREIIAPYEFERCFKTAYRHLRDELEEGHHVHVNAAAIPELVGLGYVSAARMLASELRTAGSTTLADLPEEAAISTYYSAPDSFPALDFLERRRDLRRINESLADLDSIDDYVEMDREFVDLIITLFEEDVISTLLDALESTSTESDSPDPALEDFHAGLVDVRDGLEQFAEGLDTIGDADLPDPSDHPELISQLVQSLWRVDGIDFTPSTFEILQKGADRIGSDPARMFAYFDDRLQEIETIVEDANPLSKEQLEELIDISARVANHGLTSGHRQFDDDTWAVTLPNELNPDLSPFQHAIVYTLAVAGNDVDSTTELTHGLVDFALGDPNRDQNRLDWTQSQIEHSFATTAAGDTNDTNWRENLLDQNPEDNFDNVIQSLRSKVQYNLDNLADAGFVEWIDPSDVDADIDNRIQRIPRLTTAGRYWTVVHYEPIDDV